MAEDLGAELGTVDRPVLSDQVLAERCHHLLEGLGAGFVGLVTKQVGIDRGRAEFSQLVDDGRLARGNPAGESN